MGEKRLLICDAFAKPLLSLQLQKGDVRDTLVRAGDQFPGQNQELVCQPFQIPPVIGSLVILEGHTERAPRSYFDYESIVYMFRNLQVSRLEPEFFGGRSAGFGHRIILKNEKVVEKPVLKRGGLKNFIKREVMMCPTLQHPVLAKHDYISEGSFGKQIHSFAHGVDILS